MWFFWVSISLLAGSSTKFISLLLECLEVFVLQLQFDSACDPFFLHRINGLILESFNRDFVSNDAYILILFLCPVSEISFLNSLLLFIYLINCFCSRIIDSCKFSSTRDRVILLIDELNKLFTLFISDLSILFSH
jgi:hypothetical protein